MEHSACVVTEALRFGDILKFQIRRMRLRGQVKSKGRKLKKSAFEKLFSLGGKSNFTFSA